MKLKLQQLLSMALLLALVFVINKHMAYAATFMNEYPDMDAAVYNLQNFDWWKDENGDGKVQVPSELISSRLYYYRNCTDGVSWWVLHNLPGYAIPANWNNANAWDSNAPAAQVTDGATNNIEPGDIAQSDDGSFGHVGFVTNVVKNSSGVVTSIEVAELNKDSDGNYSLFTYNTRNSLGKFTRSGTYDWDNFIDVNGPGKGLNNESWPAAASDTSASSSGSVQTQSNQFTQSIVQGPNNSLSAYWTTPGQPWNGPATITSAGTAFARPSTVIAQPTQFTQVFSMGANNSLYTYWTTPGQPWNSSANIAGTNSIYSEPSAVYTQSNGFTQVFARGPNNSLVTYFTTPGQPWNGPGQIDPAGTTFSTPAAVVTNANGFTQVFNQGPSNNLKSHWNSYGQPWYTSIIDGNGTTYAQPSAVITQTTGFTQVFKQGTSNGLVSHWNNYGQPWYTGLVNSNPVSFSPTATVISQSNGFTQVITQGPNNRLYGFWNNYGQPWGGPATIGGIGSTYSAP